MTARNASSYFRSFAVKTVDLSVFAQKSVNVASTRTL